MYTVGENSPMTFDSKTFTVLTLWEVFKIINYFTCTLAFLSTGGEKKYL